MRTMKMLLACFVLATLTLPPALECRSSAQQGERGQGVKSANAGKPERRVALVIGNGNYAVRPLANPPNDARALAKALTDLGFEVLSGENLKRAEMQQKLRAFEASLRGSTVGLFFFAGHGVQVDGINYLIPIGAEIETETDVDAEAVSANQVLSRMYAADNPINLLILDACRDNPFRGFKRSGARGLAQLRALSGTLIAYATAPDDTAADGTGSNSPYTTEMLQHIRTPGLKIEDFFKRVGRGVEIQTNGQQQPWVSSSLREDFYFVSPQPTAPLPPTYLAETAPISTPNVNPPPPSAATLLSFEFKTVRLDNTGNILERRIGQAHYFTEDLGKGVKLEMVEIPGGTFQMGSNDSDNEKPPHSVTVKSFWIGKFEVTQAQWKAVMGKNPSKFNYFEFLPVERVSWNDVQKFLEKLNARANLQGKNYRLPTEAEWEYAARAGTTTPFAFGETITTQYVNFNNEQTRVVGSTKVANGFGVFDMHGNVSEWCQDVYHSSYNIAPSDGSAWLSGGDSRFRVARNCSWLSSHSRCRSSRRGQVLPGVRSREVGFRVVVSERNLNPLSPCHLCLDCFQAERFGVCHPMYSKILARMRESVRENK